MWLKNVTQQYGHFRKFQGDFFERMGKINLILSKEDGSRY
jgi:hypothetical protein